MGEKKRNCTYSYHSASCLNPFQPPKLVSNLLSCSSKRFAKKGETITDKYSV